VVPVFEEEVRVARKLVETGRVRVSKKVTEQEETVDVPLKHEEVQVERVPRNVEVTGRIPQMRQKGDTTIIPILREEVVVQKRLILVEELHVTKRVVKTSGKVKTRARKEEAKVERLRPGKRDGAG
jgi:uncharacterized protein (TIGR02271 family)